MRRSRNKVRPAKVRYADGFRRFLESFAGAYCRVGEPVTLILPADRISLNHAVDGVMPDQFFRPKKWEMSRYMTMKPIVTPASALKQPTTWTAREVEVMLRQAMLRSYYPTEDTE